jgi:hypothetical protein
MKRPPLSCLLLLPLLAVLLFGNCGGGVQRLLNDSKRRDRLQAIVLREKAERAAARKDLRGQARQDEYWRIEQTTKARLDSLLPGSFLQRKLRNRRNKIERQVLRLPPPASQAASH